MYNFSAFSVQWLVSPIFNSILLFYFVLSLFMYLLCVKIKCVFCSIMHGEICAMLVEMYVLVLCNGMCLSLKYSFFFFCFVFCFFLFLYVFLINFSSLPNEDSWFTTVLDGNIRGFVNLPHLVFESTSDTLGTIRNIYIYIYIKVAGNT